MFILSVDSFDELGEYGSPERTSKLSPIGYKHENELAGEKGKGVNESSTEGNALRTVLGMFGAVKDKDGNFLINDDYDNVDDIVYWIEIPTKAQKGE